MRGDLRRSNYTKTVFGRGWAPDPARELMSHLDHRCPRAPRSPLLNWYLHFLDQRYASGFKKPYTDYRVTSHIFASCCTFSDFVTSVTLRCVLQTTGYASWRGTLGRVPTITPSGTLNLSGVSVGASSTAVAMATLIDFHPKMSVDLCVCSSVTMMSPPPSLRPRGLSRGLRVITDVKQTTPLETSMVISIFQRKIWRIL